MPKEFDVALRLDFASDRNYTVRAASTGDAVNEAESRADDEFSHIDTLGELVDAMGRDFPLGYVGVSLVEADPAEPEDHWIEGHRETQRLRREGEL